MLACPRGGCEQGNCISTHGACLCTAPPNSSLGRETAKRGRNRTIETRPVTGAPQPVRWCARLRPLNGTFEVEFSFRGLRSGFDGSLDPLDDLVRCGVDGYQRFAFPRGRLSGRRD